MGALDKILGLLPETITSSAVTGIGNTIGNQVAMQQQQAMWDIQAQKSFEYNERSADNAHKRTIDLYNQLQSPKAIVKQLKEAGLNPALMYSQSGIGGKISSGAQGNGINASGASPVLGMLDPLAMAQLENIKADTRNKEKDSGLKGSQTLLNEANTAIKEVEKQILDRQNELDEITFGYKFQELIAKCASAVEQANIDRTNGIINDATHMTQIETVQQNLANLKATHALLRANKNLTDQQIQESLQRVNEMSANIWLMTSQAEIKEEELLQLIDNREWNYITKEDAKFVTSEVLDTFEEVYKAMKSGKEKQNLGIILKFLKAMKK